MVVAAMIFALIFTARDRTPLFHPSGFCPPSSSGNSAEKNEAPRVNQRLTILGTASCLKMNSVTLLDFIGLQQVNTSDS
jgi:hypothetical protein